MESAAIIEELRHLLRDAEKSRYHISKETGLSQSLLSRFLNDEERGLSLHAAAALAEYFGWELTLRRPK